MILFISVHCVPGKYLMSECEPCPIGTFKTDSGNAECTPCDDGYTTRVEGAITSVECDIGKLPPMLFVLVLKSWKMKFRFQSLENKGFACFVENEPVGIKK